MSVTSTALTVIDRGTGEIIDVRDAPTERLAQFHDDADGLKAEIADAQAVVNRELVARLDRDARWTLRVGDPTGTRQFEIKAPSPDAGTETYPANDLEEELRSLVDRGTISPQAAGKALQRRVVIEVDVPLDVDLDALAETVGASVETELAGAKVTVVKAIAARKSVIAGVKALRKVSGTNAALDRVKVTLPTGERRAKITIKTRDAA